MKQRLILFTMATILSLSVMARDFEYKGVWYTVIDEDNHTCQTKAGELTVGNYPTYKCQGNNIDTTIQKYLEIPSSVNDGENEYKVVSIGIASFGENTFNHVIIPESVESIQSYAFYKCSSLEKITMKPGVKSINENAFSNCEKLYDIQFPSSLQEIKESAFSSCKSLVSIEIPEGVRSISGSFIWCSNLTNVKFSDGLELIGPSTFKQCVALKEIIFPSTLKIIKSNAFCQCYGLEKIRFNEGLKTIEYGAFYQCIALQNLELSSSVSSLGEQAFLGCRSLREIHLNHVETIGIDCFNLCESLTDIDFGDALKQVSGFSYCRKIKSINLPYTVQTIDNKAFYECSSIESINLSDNLMNIGDNAFYGCSSLVSINLPNSINKIGNYCFCNCTALKEIKICDSISILPSCFLTGCKSLVRVDIPDSVETIGDGCFSSCSSLSTIKIGNHVKTIGRNAFNGCSVSELEFPATLEDIFEQAFFNLPNLKKLMLTSLQAPGIQNQIFNNNTFKECRLYIPEQSFYSYYTFNNFYSSWQRWNSFENIRLIGQDEDIYKIEYKGVSYIIDPVNKFAMPVESESHSTISRIIIPEYIVPEDSEPDNKFLVSEIWDRAFFNSEVEEISLPSSLRYIGNQAFSGCKNLTSVTIPNQVNALGSAVFQGCSKLKNVKFGFSLATMEDNCFSQCAIEEIVTPPLLKHIPTSTFSQNALRNVTIGACVESMGDWAFNINSSIENIFILNENPPYANANNFETYAKAAVYVPEGGTSIYSETLPWSKFTSFGGIHEIECPKSVVLSETERYITEGEEFQLVADIYPSTVSIKDIFWESSNPNIAKVDNDGRVTVVMHSDSSLRKATMRETDNNICEIRAYTPFSTIPISLCTLRMGSGPTSLPTITDEMNESVYLYDFSGNCIGYGDYNILKNQLPKGIYIIRNGGKSHKIIIH